MASLKLISAALFAAAVIAAPAMARDHHARRVTSDVAVAAPEAAVAGPVYGYRCVPAPRVGAFASAPWDTSVPCEPAYSPQAYY
jgi:hypothetical protein